MPANAKKADFTQTEFNVSLSLKNFIDTAAEHEACPSDPRLLECIRDLVESLKDAMTD